MDKDIRKNGQKDPRYGDPTWMYLNSLGRVPLMGRGQESQHAILIRFAQRELLEMAFKTPLILDALYRIGDQLEEGLIEPADVLRVEEDQIKDPEKVEKARRAFIEEIGEIRALYGEAKKLKDLAALSGAAVLGAAASAGAVSEHQRKNSDPPPVSEELLQKIETFEDQYIEKCQQLRLNTRQVRDILEKYKAFLQENKQVGLLKSFTKLEAERNHAKTSFIEANVRLVVSIAKRYVHRGMEISDLIQEGNKGLIKAVDNFDYHKGYKFSTYAIWWIREAITRAIHEKSKAIHLPASTFDLVNKVEQFSRRWSLQHGTRPSVDKIAAELKCSVEKVEFALECAETPISLDMEMGNSDGATIGEYIEDTQSVDPLDRLSLGDLRAHIDIVLGELDSKERETVIMRFGLDDGRIKTLAEIGAKLKLTNERVRQIEIKALKKLKQSNAAQELEPWKEDFGNIAESEY